MKRFGFPLDAALRWRMEQAREEERKLEKLRDELSSRRRVKETLRVRVSAEENSVLEPGGAEGSQLQALDAFKRRAREEDIRIAAAIAVCEKQIAEQLGKTIEARRASKLLEHLREKRLSEWRASFQRELEASAAELFLARRGRG